MTACDWAACHRTDATYRDGWNHCPTHMRLHVTFEIEAAQHADRRSRGSARSQVRTLHAAGLTDRQIAAHMGYAETSARTLRHELGLTANPPTSRKIAECGTRAGLQRHKRLEQQPCLSCLSAERAYQRERKRLMRQRTAA